MKLHPSQQPAPKASEKVRSSVRHSSILSFSVSAFVCFCFLFVFRSFVSLPQTHLVAVDLIDNFLCPHQLFWSQVCHTGSQQRQIVIFTSQQRIIFFSSVIERKGSLFPRQEFAFHRKRTHSIGQTVTIESGDFQAKSIRL
jgi:hypothetical protein